jgi:hypothetical protein
MHEHLKNVQCFEKEQRSIKTIFDRSRAYPWTTWARKRGDARPNNALENEVNVCGHVLLFSSRILFCQIDVSP